MRLRRGLSKFLRGLRNKIQESLKKEGGGRDRLTETHSGRFNKNIGNRRKGFGFVINKLFKIKF